MLTFTTYKYIPHTFLNSPVNFWLLGLGVLYLYSCKVCSFLHFLSNTSIKAKDFLGGLLERSCGRVCRICFIFWEYMCKIKPSSQLLTGFVLWGFFSLLYLSPYSEHYMLISRHVTLKSYVLCDLLLFKMLFTLLNLNESHSWKNSFKLLFPITFNIMTNYLLLINNCVFFISHVHAYNNLFPLKWFWSFLYSESQKTRSGNCRPDCYRHGLSSAFLLVCSSRILDIKCYMTR